MTEIISGPASASAKVTDQPTIPPSPPGRSIGPAGAPSTPRPGFWSWRRRPFRFLLLGILLLCLILGGSNWYHYLWAVHYYRAAEKARQQRDFSRAQSFARLSLQAWPNDPQTYFFLARITRQAGEFDRAEDELDNCQRLEGSSERIRLERALLLVQQGALTRSSE